MDKVDETNVPFDRMLPLYDSLILLCGVDEQLKYMHINFLVEKAEIYNKNSNYEGAFRTYNLALEQINKSFDTTLSEIKKKCMYSIALSSMKLRMFDKSVTYAMDLLEYIGNNDLDYQVQAYSMLSYIFINAKKKRESDLYDQKALQIVKNNDKIGNDAAFRVYNNHACLFFSEMQCDSIIKYLSKAEQFIQNISDAVEYKNIIYHNFSVMYQKLHEYKIAEEYILKAIKMLENSNNKYLYLTVANHYNLATIYLEMGMSDKALYQFNKSIEISSLIGMDNIKGKAYIAMSGILYKNGEFKQSVEYLNKGMVIQDSIFNLQNADRMLSLSNSFEEKGIKNYIKQIENKLEISLNIIYILITGIVLIFIVLVYFILAFRKACLKNSFLNSTNNNLNVKLTTYQQKSKSEIATTIDVKNRELASLTLDLIKNNNILLEYQAIFHNIERTKDSVSKDNILKELSVVINQYHPDKYWNDFKFYFEQVHQSFFINISQQYPDLTYSQQRICALLFLNLSTKEIATITNKSVRTIETGIYRIRKIFNISGEVKINIYLQKFISV